MIEVAFVALGSYDELATVDAVKPASNLPASNLEVVA